MSSGALNWDRAGWGLRTGLLAMVLMLAGTAAAWDQPKEWPDIGMVSKWKEYDARFYRIYQDAPFSDESQFKFNQAKQYEKTHEYNGKLDGIVLADYLTRDEKEQADRRKQASRELKFVADFHFRMMTMVQRTKEQQGSGWGIQVNDMTVMGDCLGKLRTAVGLDPSNPYAWHVLAYFANTVGDMKRSAGALNGGKQACLWVLIEKLADDLEKASVACTRVIELEVF